MLANLEWPANPKQPDRGYELDFIAACHNEEPGWLEERQYPGTFLGRYICLPH